MRNIHRPAKPGRETVEHDANLPSKSARKAEMQALQELGERLIELPADRLKRVPLPDYLREGPSLKLMVVLDSELMTWFNGHIRGIDRNLRGCAREEA